MKLRDVFKNLGRRIWLGSVWLEIIGHGSDALSNLKLKPDKSRLPGIKNRYFMIFFKNLIQIKLRYINNV